MYGQNNSIVLIFTASCRRQCKDSHIREFPFPAHLLLIPCSDFPEKTNISAKPPYSLDLSKEKCDQGGKFPVFFPVSRELGAEFAGDCVHRHAVDEHLVSRENLLKMRIFGLFLVDVVGPTDSPVPS